ncbi:nucleotidyltransferase family protein [Streptomyces sp. NRRL WC-3742]|uniref:nucleotidyltransferase family protein n=1 Tax=Streptomyces sp. NRRL WC-3742 TaxID=1463934 RepID=UPI001F401E69|nr:nucleotidyltransferase family protein [Streptomyces sp. NRRL WC-3742]
MFLDYRVVRDNPTYAHVTAEGLRELADSGSYDEQAAAFASIALRNGSVRAVLERLAGLEGLPPWYLTAGSLFQTVWNAAAGREDLRAGIRDHDLFFFDEDTSWEAEDVVIKRCLAAVEDLGVELEPRNQARVHLWYPEKWGKEIAPYRDLPHAISSFAATSCCVGLSLDAGGKLDVHSTHGFADLFRLVLRPNPLTVAPQAVYDAKAERWMAEWPQLTKLPWAEPADPAR